MHLFICTINNNIFLFLKIRIFKSDFKVIVWRIQITGNHRTVERKAARPMVLIRLLTKKLAFPHLFFPKFQMQYMLSG